MFNNFMDFIANNWNSIIIFMVLILFFCFIFGYFANAFLLTKFELGAVWQGILTVTGAGMVGIGKYYINSKYNSNQGESPK